MSKLTGFYTHKAALKEKVEAIDAQWAQLEDQLIKRRTLACVGSTTSRCGIRRVRENDS